VTGSGAALGIGAAVAWGLVDIGVVLLSRRATALNVTLAVHASGLVLLVLLALALREPLTLTPGQWAAVVALGPVAGLSYLAFYRALALGPVAVVSPILSANGAVVVLFAVVVLGEQLTQRQALGCTVVLGCVTLASLQLGGRRSGEPGGGTRLALAASVAFGGYLFGVVALAGELGWLAPILLTRASGVALLAVLARRTRERSLTALGAPWLALAVAAGAFEALGYLLFNRGAELGQAAVTSAAASVYPLLPMAFGFIALGERLAPHQAAGVAGVLIGMVLLGLG
jgi:drug/metabolite transporter (DMT)-like permease